MGSIYDALTSCTRFQGAVNAAGRRDNSTQTDLMPILDKGQDSENDPQKKQSSLETALQLVQRAVAADKSRRYEDALQLYQHALVYFLESINYETESEKVKEKILSKCKQYLDRAEKISEYLNSSSDSRRRKPSYMGSRPNLSTSTGDVSRTGSTDSGAGSGSGSPNQARKSTIISHGSIVNNNLLPITNQSSVNHKEFASLGTQFNFPIDKQPSQTAIGKIYASLGSSGSGSLIRQKSDN